MFVSLGCRLHNSVPQEVLEALCILVFSFFTLFFSENDFYLPIVKFIDSFLVHFHSAIESIQ